MPTLRNRLYHLLRASEKYTKTDMVYLAKGGFWMNLNYVVVNTMAFVLSIAFAHLLSKDAYGIYQFILAVGAILSSLTLTGMNSAVMRAVARGKEGPLQASIPIQLRYNSGVLAVALGIAIYYWFHQNATLALGVLIFGALMPLYATFNTYTALIGGRKDYFGGFIFGTILSFVYSACMLASLFFIHNPALLIFVNIGTNALVTGILYRVALAHYKPNDEQDPDTISYGKHLSFANIITSIANNVDSILVFHFMGPSLLALYTFAGAIPERMNGILKSIPVLAFPKLSTKPVAELRGALVRKSLQFAGITLLVTIIYTACTAPLFRLLFPQYQDAVLYSQGYALALVFASLLKLPLQALTVARAQKEIYLYNLTSATVSIVLMSAMLIAYGIWGLIASRALSGIVNYLLILFLFPSGEASSAAVLYE